MSWSIPAQIEKDFLSGKAQYRTFQTGVGGQSILTVPSNAYVVIFGYDYHPAGGGLTRVEIGTLAANTYLGPNIGIGPFATQQISFYTGTDFFPFIHHFDNEVQTTPRTINETDPASVQVTHAILTQVNTSPIARQTYIVAHQDVTITVGLIKTIARTSANAIPVTNRTPLSLTYGGSGQVINTQTDFGPAANPLQFMQPSPKDYADFAFGVLPNNADNQAFATPDIARGLQDPSNYVSSLIGAFGAQPEPQYFLCCHYALYNRTVPEELG